LYRRISSGPKHIYALRNKAGFYGEHFLTPRQNPRL